MVLLTFGLLSPDKGIEYVIDALPAIVASCPSAVYIVLGATHPHVKDEQGEAYRLMLEARARQLGVDEHVMFHDRFVEQDELNEFLGAADVYVTPYLNPEQSTSGTLAYAVGSGRAVISTPYVYAREMLSDDRGVLVPYRDADAISIAVRDLLADDERRDALRSRAASHGRSMQWPAVAGLYHQSFARAVREQASDARVTFQAATLARRVGSLPPLDLRHLRALTDDTGLLQHATFCVPRYAEGYCLDDNARGLLLMARMEEAGTENRDAVRALATRYLAFVHAAFDPAQARFRNFMTYGRAWAEPLGSEDSHGHAVQALGTVIGRAHRAGRRAGERAVPRRPAGHDRLHQPARVGHDAARHRRLPARLRGRSAGRGRAQPPRGSAARRLRADPVGRVALVRGRTDLRQRAAAACAHRLRREDGPGRPRHGRPARADVARQRPAGGGRPLRPDRHQRVRDPRR